MDAVMQRENGRDRMVAVGKPTNDGANRTLPAVRKAGECGLNPQGLTAMHAPARCGRSLPPLHLAELDEVFTQRRRRRAPIVLCGADDVADPDHDDDEDCLGCADCLRYCPNCVRSAVDWSARCDASP